QHGLFGTAAAPAPTPFELREAAPWSEEERLASEYAMLGFYVSGHPLAKYASRLMDLKTISLDQVEDQRNGKEITVAALIVGSPPPCQVVFELCSLDGSVAVLQAQQRVKSSPELVDAIREICGNPAVRMVPE